MSKHKPYTPEQLARKRAWRAANKDRINAARRAARTANPDQPRADDRARNKAYREANKVRINANRRASRKANRHKVALTHRKSRLKIRYGLTIADFDAMAAKQKNRCACCACTFGPLTATPCVDHCHATGRVRGLVCDRCNLLLGHADDNPQILRTCARYLERKRSEYLQNGPDRPRLTS